MPDDGLGDRSRFSVPTEPLILTYSGHHGSPRRVGDVSRRMKNAESRTLPDSNTTVNSFFPRSLVIYCQASRPLIPLSASCETSFKHSVPSLFDEVSHPWYFTSHRSHCWDKRTVHMCCGGLVSSHRRPDWQIFVRTSVAR